MEEPALAENESNKFLGYAHKQADSLPAGQPLYFSNIVPEKTTAPAVAAQALYHLLGLAMKGAVKVDQPIAFGEVRLTVLLRLRRACCRTEQSVTQIAIELK